MGVISRFGLDEKKENLKKKAAFLFCVSNENGKKKKLPLESDFS